MILYINACVRGESRTHRIAKALLETLGGAYEEVKLAEEKPEPLSEQRLRERTELIEKGDYTAPMFRLARQFQAADVIVIAAPYWDFGFPAVLKAYLENIYVTGLVSEYNADGTPHGLCRARMLYYVTTAGGPYIPDFSYDYIRALAVTCFGIPETKLIKAEMLDVDGFDAEKIVDERIKDLLADVCTF